MSGKRRGRRKQLDASHQRNWLIGRHAVSEVLKAGTWPYTRLCITADASAALAEILVQRAEHADRTPAAEYVAADRLTELCGSRHHQGVAAQMGPFPYHSLPDLSQRLRECPRSCGSPPLIVVCDRIQDGHNLGAILRSCDAMAVDALILADSQQIGVTPQVARAAAGAVNHVPIYRCAQLPEAVAVLHDAGIRILAASEKSSMPIWNLDASVPTAFIIGSEAHGVADSLLELCDQRIAVPMFGQVGSLNAAVAAGILLYEFRRDRR